MILRRQAALGYPTFPVTLWLFWIFVECSQLDTRNLNRTSGNVFEDLLAPNEPTAACLGNVRSVTNLCLSEHRKSCSHRGGHREKFIRNWTMFTSRFARKFFSLESTFSCRRSLSAKIVCLNNRGIRSTEMHVRKLSNLSTFLCWKRLYETDLFRIIYITTTFRNLIQDGWKRLSRLIYFVLIYIATIFRSLIKDGTMFYYLPMKVQMTNSWSVDKIRVRESDHLSMGIVRTRNTSKSFDTKRSDVGYHGEETYRSKDQDTNFRGQEPKNWNKGYW